MPTLAQLQAKVDSWVDTNWDSVIVATQDAYLATHGNYFQGLVTHSTPPDTQSNKYNSTTGDNLATSPHDQSETWLDVFPSVNTPIDFSLVSNVYTGPLGKGFWLVLDVLYQGVLYRRSKGHGPENHDLAWHEVIVG